MNKAFHQFRMVFFAAPALCAIPATASSRDTGSLVTAVAAADLRLESIGFRLSTANAAICNDKIVGTGLVLRSLREYGQEFRKSATAALGFSTPVIVEAVVAGSPAAKAGIRPGDGLVRVDGARFPEALPSGEEPASLADLTAAQKVFESLHVETDLSFEIQRGGANQIIHLTPLPACRTWYSLVLNERGTSDADGSTVRIGARLLERLSDEGLAVVVAHELAHNILHHPAELERLKVRQGLAAEFGRSARETLRTEDEADRLSVQLLVRAGYPPHLPAHFWRTEGRALTGFLPRGPSHRGWLSRAKLTEDEANRVQSAQ